ncbi:MAG: ABC transporter substrate-binding protein [Candidatus Aminicenantales bacterium]
MISFLILSLWAAVVVPQESIIYDDLDRPFTLTAAPPQRIVSLAPNITEILFALGLGGRVVGVTRFCDFPAEALQKEKIGGMVDLNLEKIEALHPDLIVAFRGNPLGLLNKLRRLHFPVFVLDLGNSVDGLFRTIAKIGRVTRAEKPAEVLVDSLKNRYREIRLLLRDISRKPKVFLSVYGQGLWTCGEGSYLNDLLDQAGGINISGTIKRRWLQLNREQFIHENPDVIIIMAKDEVRFSESRESFRADPRLKDVRAVKENAIHWLDENIAGRFGPRLIDALDAVARILHPVIFEARG